MTILTTQQVHLLAQVVRLLLLLAQVLQQVARQVLHRLQALRPQVLQHQLQQ